eukprot:153-Ditylum_brightwellii.AAC.1
MKIQCGAIGRVGLLVGCSVHQEYGQKYDGHWYIGVVSWRTTVGSSGGKLVKWSCCQSWAREMFVEFGPGEHIDIVRWSKGSRICQMQ